MAYKIILVDDHPIDIIQKIRNAISGDPEKKFDSNIAKFSKPVFDKAEEKTVAGADIALIDYYFEEPVAGKRLNGIDVLKRLHEINPGMGKIILSRGVPIDEKDSPYQMSYREFKTAVTQYDLFDYLNKDIPDEVLLLKLNLLVMKREKQREQFSLFSSLWGEEVLGKERENIVFVGQSAAQVAADCEKLGRLKRRFPILIEGDSGTGKELAARMIHRSSDSKPDKFVVVNCGGIPEDLFETEFFGAAAGAYTDLKEAKVGYMLKASGYDIDKGKLAEPQDIKQPQGTLFLDEIGEIPYHKQAFLLRAIENQEITMVGDPNPKKINVKIICATNRNLREGFAASREGGGQPPFWFREDLYRRISLVRLKLKNFRERPEDILPLIEFYLNLYLKELQQADKRVAAKSLFTADALERIHSFPWHQVGNVRGLQAFCLKAIVENMRLKDLSREEVDGILNSLQ